MNALQNAIDHIGGVGRLAEAIQVNQSTVSMWKNRGRVPGEYCRAIEFATEGAVTRYHLRPDVFGESPDDVPLSEAG